MALLELDLMLQGLLLCRVSDRKYSVMFFPRAARKATCHHRDTVTYLTLLQDTEVV